MMNKSKGKMIKGLRQALMVSVSLLVICGLLFPLVLSGISAILFPHQANGSTIEVNGEIIGAEFVGQDFTKEYFMKCRPSAYRYNTYTIDGNGNEVYNDGTEFAGLASGSNNYSATNPALAERVEKDIQEFLDANPSIRIEDIPTDLLTASGSGLDPHISPASAKVQIPAIAKASGLTQEQLQQIVDKNTTGKLFGVLGEEVTNVVKVNLDIAQAMGIINK